MFEENKYNKQYCISVFDLRQTYGSFNAIDGISFNLEYKKVFGFLGPNGAGKTTTIKILTILIQPSSGTVKIFGKDNLSHSMEIRKRIGVVMQQPSFEANLTVERALELYGFMWKLPSRKRKEKVIELLNAFDLENIRNTKNDELSIGQRRRVQVAREFMHDMDLLFLDEPTVGLDPSARRTLLDYIKMQVRDGLTVFFTTHIMEEAEYLCDQVAIIDNGRIIAFDTPTELKRKYGAVKHVEIKLKNVSAQSVLYLVDSVISEKKSDIETKPPQNWIYIDADIPSGHGIYYSSDENRIHKVLPPIRGICNSINNDVAGEIAQYHTLNNTIDISLREFQRKLNIILHKTKLPLKKKWIFLVKCNFIKADLE